MKRHLIKEAMMSLDAFYHESLKKWLKGKCSLQADEVSDSFEGNGVQASYDPNAEVFIIHPSEKQYPWKIVEQSVCQEEDFNALIADMLKQGL